MEARLGVAGVARTVADAVPETPLSVAVMVAVPAVALAAAKPAVLIEIIVEFEEFQTTDEVISCVLLSEKLPVAVNCWIELAASEGFAGETVIETRVATLGLESPPILPAVAVMAVAPAD